MNPNPGKNRNLENFELEKSHPIVTSGFGQSEKINTIDFPQSNRLIFRE